MMELISKLRIEQIAGPIYLLVIMLEATLLRRRADYDVRDSAATFGTLIGASLERPLTAIAYAAMLTMVYQFRLFDIGFEAWAWLVCFIACDHSYYWKHRLEHRIRLGWASHNVHHSSQHFNFSVALRQTWTFGLTGLIVVYFPVALLGFHPAMIASCIGANLIYQFFVHTETVKRLPGWYEAIMNTPSHHRVHHGSNPKYMDANYAGTLIIWDRLFGSFVAEDDNEPVRYGLVNDLKSFNVFTIQFHEWTGIFRDVIKPGLSLKHRLCYIFMPPGWSHDGSRETTEIIQERFRNWHDNTADDKA